MRISEASELRPRVRWRNVRQPGRTPQRGPTALKRVALIVAGVLLFLAISALLARFLSVENVERDDLAALIDARGRATSTGCCAS